MTDTIEQQRMFSAWKDSERGLKQQLVECREKLREFRIYEWKYGQLKKALVACRADRETTLNELGAALCAGDALRTLLQRTLDYHRQTDSTRTPKEVIADLVAGLEVKT